MHRGPKSKAFWPSVRATISYMYRYTQSRTGFTLVELLVVMGIIFLLASVVFVAVNSAREGARDKQRKVDLKNLQLAIELYKEAHGQYPPECPNSTTWVGPGPLPAWGTQCDDDWISGLAPNFIPELPEDPTDEQASGRGYLYQTTGTEYKVIINMTVESNLVEARGDEFSRYQVSCPGTHHAPDTYAIFHDESPGNGAGAECW